MKEVENSYLSDVTRIDLESYLSLAFRFLGRHGTKVASLIWLHMPFIINSSASFTTN